jgi:hypothetical protein
MLSRYFVDNARDIVAKSHTIISTLSIYKRGFPILVYYTVGLSLVASWVEQTVQVLLPCMTAR